MSFSSFRPAAEEDFSSISSWVMESLGHIPKVGDQFTCENLQITVTEIHRMRVMQIRVDLLPEPEEEE